MVKVNGEKRVILSFRGYVGIILLLMGFILPWESFIKHSAAKWIGMIIAIIGVALLLAGRKEV